MADKGLVTVTTSPTTLLEIGSQEQGISTIAIGYADETVEEDVRINISQLHAEDDNWLLPKKGMTYFRVDDRAIRRVVAVASANTVQVIVLPVAATSK
jgi:hypothetical protein